MISYNSKHMAPMEGWGGLRCGGAVEYYLGVLHSSVCMRASFADWCNGWGGLDDGIGGGL